ncbi:MAG: hypothetical protein PUF10_02295 [Bacteroidales bacterium]|nr:hypothetical protein [Bacteroidales bacterium]
MKYFLSIILLLATLTCIAQKTVTICGEYRYIAPENVSPAEAKATATERARLEAMANEFGTNVSQTNLNTTRTNNGEAQNDFLSFGGTEVKGNWLGDTKEPEISVTYEQNQLVVTAKVCGKAREIVNASVDLSVKVLCNGVESERFKNNDKLSVVLKTPVHGYLAIFLRDDVNGIVACLLPYETENGKARKIKRNEFYTLLSTSDPLYPYREETILVTEREQEFNTLIFVFSENEFAMPNTENGEYLPELSIPDFQKWLRRNRMRDEKMQTLEKIMEIRN